MESVELIEARLVGGPNDGFIDHLRSDRLPQLVTVRYCDGCKRRHLFMPHPEPCEATYLLTPGSDGSDGSTVTYHYVSVDRTLEHISISAAARLTRR